jgi:hypothetical protein
MGGWIKMSKRVGSSTIFMEIKAITCGMRALNVRCNALTAQHNIALGNAQGLLMKRNICPVGTIQPEYCVVPTGQIWRGLTGNMGLRPMLNCVVPLAHCSPQKYTKSKKGEK